MSNIAAIDAPEFEREVLQAQQPVLVDFWAPWCPPCRALAPLLEELSARHGDRLKIVKCDVDKNAELSQSYGVGKIPHLLLFQNGQPVSQAVGHINRAQLARCVQEGLGDNPNSEEAGP
jgi:thioredoxin 1